MSQRDFKQLPSVEVARDRKERQKYDDYGDFFAIIIAMEHLETAFVRDIVSDKEYVIYLLPFGDPPFLFLPSNCIYIRYVDLYYLFMLF